MTFSKSYDFSGLLSAQIIGLIEAEAKAAQTIAEYIEQIGFEKTTNPDGTESDGMGKLRNVSFEMERQDGLESARKHKISMPLLSMVPIPSLSIEEAELDFALRIDDVTETEVKTENEKNTVKPLTAPQSSVLSKSFISSETLRNRTVRPSLKAGFTGNAPRAGSVLHSSETKTSADLKVKVKVSRGDFPAGLSKLLEIADLGLKDTDVKAVEAVKNSEQGE